ncbi:MAG: peptide chain release factor 1 [Chromatiales bacterium]|nr:peptide chain release factor 1 [Chromatiales bacterium]
MKASILKKLETVAEHHRQIALQLSKPEVMQNQEKYKKLGQEYAQLDPIVKLYATYQDTEIKITEAAELLNEQDEALRIVAQDEIEHLQQEQAVSENKLMQLLIPQDPHDQADIFLEIRAGTGGDEAAIFAGDLFRMYSRYVERKRWQIEILNLSEGEHGGFKEIISKIKGKAVYSRLKFESGAHRVQRVPETESQGRVHTSAATVAVMPEAQEIDHIEIDMSEVRIDTFRASGAGGQHVNKTDSAIRLTHRPSGIVVECQDERSQHKNKMRAISLLQAKLLDAERRKQEQEHAENRRNLVGSGDRSERIRTYNFPQGRVTDHRITLTLYQLSQLMEGDLDMLITPLVNEHQADLLTELSKE